MVGFVAGVTIAAYMMVSPVQDYRAKSDIAEILPSPNAYVLCSGEKCLTPTPKERKVVLKRYTPAPVKQTVPDSKESYGKIYSYLKEQQVKQEPSAAVTTRPVATPAASASRVPARVQLAKAGVAAVKDTDEDTTLTVHFDLRSSVLSAAEKAKLADWLFKMNALTYEVRGYTCSQGTAAVNLKLSQQRANAVQKFIVSKFKNANVASEGMGVGHYGSDDQPELNRRAEIRAIIGPAPASMIDNKSSGSR